MMATYQKCYICEQDVYPESVEECLRAALARAEAAESELATLRAQLDAATELNTDLLNDIIRLTGRVNELEDAGWVDEF